MKTKVLLVVFVLVFTLTGWAANLDGYKNAKWGSNSSEVQVALSIQLQKQDYSGLDYIFYAQLGVPKYQTYGVWSFDEKFFPKENFETYLSGSDTYIFYNTKFALYRPELISNSSVVLKELTKLHGSPRSKTFTVLIEEDAANAKHVYTLYSWDAGATYIWLVKDVYSPPKAYTDTLWNLYYGSTASYNEIKAKIKNRIVKTKEAGENKKKKQMNQDLEKLQ